LLPPWLEIGPSQRYFYNPYMVAWTPIPQRFSGAITQNFGLM